MGSFSGSATEAFLEGDIIKADHLFTLKLDRSLRKSADRMLDIVGEFTESFRYIAIGLTAYLVLSGVAQLVAAVGTTDDASSSTKAKKSKTHKNKDKTEPKAETKTEKPKTEQSENLEPPK